MSIMDAPMALDWVMSDLYHYEVNCGVESFWDGGFTVFIGDHMNGRAAECGFYPNGDHGALPLSEAGNWLWLMSRQLYPALPQSGGPTKNSLAFQLIAASGMSAGTAETATQAQGEARQPGGEAETPVTEDEVWTARNTLARNMTGGVNG